MTHPRFFALPLFAAVLVAALSVPSVASAQPLNDEDVRRIVREEERLSRAHGVMMEQRRRIHEMLDRFLAGEAEGMASIADELADAMKPVILTVDLAPEEERIVWHAIAEVAIQAREIEVAIAAKDHRKAFEHYALLVSQCVQCHQVVRGWGRFEEPQALPPSAAVAPHVAGPAGAQTPSSTVPATMTDADESAAGRP